MSTETTTYKFTTKGARKLIIGDRLVSSSGKIFTVSSVVPKGTRIVVLFNDDMEIDFDPYQQMQVIKE